MSSQDALANQLPPQVPGEAAGPIPNTRRWERIAAGLGIVFVVLQVAAGSMLADAPALDAPAQEIQTYLVDDGVNVLVSATMVTLAAFFGLWFLGSLRTFLERAEGAPGRLSKVAFGAGLVTITMATTAGLPTVALAWDDTAALAEPGLLQAVWNLNTLALVPIGSSAGVFCLAIAAVILRTRVLPAWLGWLGVLAAVAGVLATFYLVADDPDSLLGTPANLGGFLLSMLFILLLSAFMVIRVGKTDPAAA
jgi:hypothetical protein